MNRIESLLRAAARDEAAEVAPESVPSFAGARLPAPRRPLVRVTIGLTDGGHAVVVRDGHVRRIPWPLSIAIPFDSNAPGTAW